MVQWWWLSSVGGSVGDGGGLRPMFPPSRAPSLAGPRGGVTSAGAAVASTMVGCIGRLAAGDFPISRGCEDAGQPQRPVLKGILQPMGGSHRMVFWTALRRCGPVATGRPPDSHWHPLKKHRKKRTAREWLGLS